MEQENEPMWKSGASTDRRDGESLYQYSIRRLTECGRIIKPKDDVEKNRNTETETDKEEA